METKFHPTNSSHDDICIHLVLLTKELCYSAGRYISRFKTPSSFVDNSTLSGNWECCTLSGNAAYSVEEKCKFSCIATLHNTMTGVSVGCVNVYLPFRSLSYIS